MRMANLLHQQLKAITIEATGIIYSRPLVRNQVKAMMQAQIKGRPFRPEQVTVHRLLLKGRYARLAACLPLARNLMLRYSGGLSHDLGGHLSLSSNMKGDLLLELPDEPAAVLTVSNFLRQLDETLAPAASAEAAL